MKSPSHAFAERFVRAGGLFIPPLDVGLRRRFEILQLERVVVQVADVWEQITHALPAEQQLAPALKEQLFVDDAAREERRDHFPVRREHPIGRVLLAAGGTQRVEIVERPGLERAREPAARLAQPGLAPQVVQLQDQIDIIERRLGWLFHGRVLPGRRTYPAFFTTPMLAMVSPFFSDGTARMKVTTPASGA